MLHLRRKFYKKNQPIEITRKIWPVKNIWTSKQTYLALGNLLNAAAELKIDVTPMEGFVVEQVNEILGLDKLNLNATLIATVGYRHVDDATQFHKKVRKSQEELFITL